MSPKQASKVPRRTRGTLSPDEILRQAFEYAESLQSVANMSVPALARHIHAPVTSIYWHFRTKSDLLDAMVLAAFKDFYSMIPWYEGDDWREGLRSFFSAFLQIFLDEPVIADLVINRPLPHDLAIKEATRELIGKRINHELKLMMDAGFSDETSWRTYAMLSTYARGCARNVMLFEERKRQSRDDYGASRTDLSPFEEMNWPNDPDRYPNLVAVMEWASPTMATSDDFRFAMDMIIKALESELTNPNASRAQGLRPVDRSRVSRRRMRSSRSGSIGEVSGDGAASG
jgi:AcrR family transcriptional regulator